MRCVLAGLLLCALSVSSWAQALPSGTSTSVPAAQAISSSPSNQNMLQTAQTSLSNATTLRQRLETRKAQAQAQVESWQTIVDSLTSENETAKQESMDLSAKLAKAEAELSKSQTALTATLKSLDDLKVASEALSMDFEKYKAEINKELKAKKLELWLWRGCALAGIVACGYFAFK